MGNLTKNLSRHEMACKNKCGFNRTDISIIHRLQVACDFAEAVVCQVRDIEDFRIVCNITSGTRCRSHHRNIYEKINGKKRDAGLPMIEIPWDSLHLADTNGISWAIDCQFPQLESMEIIIFNKMLSRWSGGFHWYPDGKFWHFDTGIVRRW